MTKEPRETLAALSARYPYPTLYDFDKSSSMGAQYLCQVLVAYTLLVSILASAPQPANVTSESDEDGQASTQQDNSPT